MAKKFNSIYKVSKETHYGEVGAALVLAASLNSTVDFQIVTAPNGTAGDLTASAEYTVQRSLRIKSKEVSNPNTGTTSAALAALDGFTKIDWESVGFATGKLRSVGTRVSIKEEFNIDAIGEAHEKVISGSVKNELITRHEDLVDAMYADSTANAVKLAYVKGETAITDALNADAKEIMLFSDKFKHMTEASKIVHIVHPSVSDLLAKEIGTSYTNEAPIYGTGFKSKMSVNGIPVIVDANLNKYQGADITARCGSITLDIESIAFKAADETKTVVIPLGLTTFAGKFFYSVNKVIDTKRIKRRDWDATGAAAVTEKAND